MKVARWGNSLAMRLPAKLVDDMGLKEGDELNLRQLGDLDFNVHREISREEMMERWNNIRWKLPKDYKFDREEANAR
jgi:antitoxin MazE